MNWCAAFGFICAVMTALTVLGFFVMFRRDGTWGKSDDGALSIFFCAAILSGFLCALNWGAQ